MKTHMMDGMSTVMDLYRISEEADADDIAETVFKALERKKKKNAWKKRIASTSFTTK